MKKNLFFICFALFFSSMIFAEISLEEASQI